MIVGPLLWIAFHGIGVAGGLMHGSSPWWSWVSLFIGFAGVVVVLAIQEDEAAERKNDRRKRS